MGRTLQTSAGGARTANGGAMGRALSWVRDVIADRGDHASVPVELEPQTAERYRLRVEAERDDGGLAPAYVAVRARPNPSPHPIVKELHACEVDGVRLEADSAEALRAKVERLVRVIAPARVLPIGYLRAPAADYELPVYPIDGGLSAPVIGGPRLRAGDLAGIRAAVARHFVSAGYLRDPEDVELTIVRPADLARVTPVAILRSAADRNVWQPVLEVDGGVQLGGATSTPPLGPHATPVLPDVVALLEATRTTPPAGVAGDGLYLTAVSRRAWRASGPRTGDAGLALLAAPVDAHEPLLRLPVRRTPGGSLCAAVADACVHVFLSTDAAALADALGNHLAAQGFVTRLEDVRVTAAA